MANSLIENIEPFMPGGNFKAYEDRINQFIKVNNIEDDNKSALFITIMGAEVYEILGSLALPKLPSQLSFEQIMKKLREHFKPQVNKRAERYKFNQIKQDSGESINDFVVRLKAIAQTCLFGEFLGEAGAEYKNKALEDTLIKQ